MPLWAHSESAEFAKNLKCKVSKCAVKCMDKSKEWVVVGRAEAVTVNILRNGVTYFQLDKGAQGEETIIVGKDHLYCKVEGQE